jgi:hypothetical protein
VCAATVFDEALAPWKRRQFSLSRAVLGEDFLDSKNAHDARVYLDLFAGAVKGSSDQTALDF